jgi:flagellar protein FlbT
MGLKINLKPGEKIVVNGCIIANLDRRATLEIENRADVLRADEILKTADANTPVLRLCHMLQIALVDAGSRKALVPQIRHSLAQLIDVLRSSCQGELAEVGAHVDASDFYTAFRKLKPVIEHERRLLAHAGTRHSIAENDQFGAVNTMDDKEDFE